MSEKVDQLLKAVLGLSREEQADFLDAYQIARCRVENGLPFDEEWLEEIERRIAEVDQGEAKTSSWEEVKRRVRGQLERG